MEFSRQECWSGLPLPSPILWHGSKLFICCKVILFSEYSVLFIYLHADKQMFLYISLCSKASLWGITPFGDLMLFMESLTPFTECLMPEWYTSGCKRQRAAVPGTEGCSRSARSSCCPWKDLNLINKSDLRIHGIDFIGTPGSFVGLPGGSDGKESVCNAGDLGLIPGSGRSPGKGNGNSLQYSCLENPMDRAVWQAIVHVVVKESDTTYWLSKNTQFSYNSN